MKKFITMLLAMVMAFSLAACSSEKPETPATTEEPAAFKAGFIFLHDENSTYDLNFLNATKEACEALGVEYMVKVRRSAIIFFIFLVSYSFFYQNPQRGKIL